MDVREWLGNYRKVDELITGKRAEKNHLIRERQRLIDIATDISAKMPDGMPYTNTGTVTQKMQNAVVAKVIIDGEIRNTENAINTYLAFKNEVIRTIEKLPQNEYGVIHRYYIRGMTLEKIAEEMGYSTRHVKRIKEKALKKLENVLVCHHTEDV